MNYGLGIKQNLGIKSGISVYSCFFPNKTDKPFSRCLISLYSSLFDFNSIFR